LNVDGALLSPELASKKGLALFFRFGLISRPSKKFSSLFWHNSPPESLRAITLTFSKITNSRDVQQLSAEQKKKLLKNSIELFCSIISKSLHSKSTTIRRRPMCQRGPLMCLFVIAVCSSLTGCSRMNGFVNNSRGASHFRQGNFAEASRHFRMAAADRPHDPDYLHNLGSTMWKQGDVNGAEQLYRRALNIDPMHQPSYHSLAKLLKDNNRPQDAQNLLTMWSQTQPYVAEPQIELAWLNRELGNKTAAEQNLRQALQVEPNNATALAHLGQVYQDQGRSGEAAGMYQRSLYQNYNQPGVKSRLSSVNGSAMPHTQHFMAQPMSPYVGGQPMLAQPMSPYVGQPMMAQPMVPYQQPVVVQNPAAPTVTLMPPIPAETTANSSSSMWVSPTPASQPVQLGSPLTNADPAHADLRFSSLPVVPAY
jgi:Tfp pilus assembly protein PilF